MSLPMKTMIDALSTWQLEDGTSTFEITDEQSGWTIRLAVEATDSLGTRLEEIALFREEPVDNLRGWAEKVAGNVRGLLEPLTLLELDEEKGLALLRSDVPAHAEAKLFYYEVRLLREGKAFLQRFQASKSVGRREQVSFTLTHEVIANVVKDLVPTVDEK